MSVPGARAGQIRREAQVGQKTEQQTPPGTAQATVDDDAREQQKQSLQAQPDQWCRH